MRLAMPGWSVGIPVGWTCIVDDHHRWVRLFLEATSRWDEGSASIQAGSVELSFEHIASPGLANVDDYAAAQMQRHVPQGRHDVAQRDLGGRATPRYQWTNGIQRIESMFALLPGVVPTTILRLDVLAVVTYTGECALDRLRDVVDAVLDRVEWQLPP